MSLRGFVKEICVQMYRSGLCFMCCFRHKFCDMGSEFNLSTADTLLPMRLTEPLSALLVAQKPFRLCNTLCVNVLGQ